MGDGRQIAREIALAAPDLVKNGGDHAHRTQDQVTDVENLQKIPAQRNNSQHYHQHQALVQAFGYPLQDRHRRPRFRHFLGHHTLLMDIDAEVKEIDEEEQQETHQLFGQRVPESALDPVVETSEEFHGITKYI